MSNEKIKMDFQSVIGLCLCMPGARGTITKVHESGYEEVTVIGDTSTHCKWCGKKWTDHKGLEDHR